MRHIFEKSKFFMSLRMVFGTLLLCGWWGFLYPQLILPEGTYRVTYDGRNPDKVSVSKEPSEDNPTYMTGKMDETDITLTGEDLLKELESSEENTICIKSKLFSMLQELLWENDNE